MKQISIISSAFLAFFVLLFIPSPAEARTCSDLLREYKQRANGWSAYAKSATRWGCGYAVGQSSKARAEAAALAGCRKVSSYSCTVTDSNRYGKAKRKSSRAPARAQPRKTTKRPAAKAKRVQNAFVPRGPCRKRWREWKDEPGFAAFMMSSEGVCTWNNNAGSIERAVDSVLGDCGKSATCKLYWIKGNEATFKNWQELLTTLGYYNSRIDGEWGPGSIAAMERFAKEAGVDNYSPEAGARLVYSARIVERYNYSSRDAIREAKTAMTEGNIDYIAKRDAPTVAPIKSPTYGELAESSRTLSGGGERSGSASPSEWYVQVTSKRDIQETIDALLLLASQHSETLEGLPPDIKTVRSGAGSIFYRGRYQAKGEAHAKEICDQLMRLSVGCFVVEDS